MRISGKKSYEARYLCYNSKLLKNVNFYLNSQLNISKNNEYRDINKNGNHHVNSYTQNQNIFVLKDIYKTVKHSSFAAKKNSLS